MALSRIKTWIAGEVLTASDLNAEFNNILNNADDLISPLPGSIDLDGNELIVDADADSSITADTDDQFDFKLGGTDIIRFFTVASAVNGIGLTGSATTDAVLIQPFGTDADIDLNLQAKGSGNVTVGSSENVIATQGGANTFSGANTISGTTTHSGILDVTGHLKLSNLSGYIYNGRLEASVSDGDLTISVKGNDGNDPSATNPVYVTFRNSTLTNGSYSTVAITAPASIVIAAGETHGIANSTAAFIYAYFINNAGTVELATSNRAVHDENIVHTTTALSASADNSDTLYSTTQRTNVAIALFGRIEIVHGAGTWDANPTYKETAPLRYKTGDQVDFKYVMLDTNPTTSDDDSDEIITGLSITLAPKRNPNTVVLDFRGAGGTNQTAGYVRFMFYGDSSSLVPSGVSEQGLIRHGVDGNEILPVTMLHAYSPASTSPIVYTVRWQVSSTATAYLGRRNADTLFDVQSSFTIKEICG